MEEMMNVVSKSLAADVRYSKNTTSRESYDSSTFRWRRHSYSCTCCLLEFVLQPLANRKSVEMSGVQILLLLRMKVYPFSYNGFYSATRTDDLDKNCHGRNILG